MIRHRVGDFLRNVSCVCLCVLFTLVWIERAESSECGNGAFNAGEQCDDGNTANLDGCSDTCQIETGWQCSAPTPDSEVPEGGFESGTPSPAWSESSTNYDSPICDEAACGVGAGSGPAQGSFWAWFGGVEAYEESALSQSLVMPETATELLFELEVSICDSSRDYLKLLIDSNQEFFIDGSSALCGNLGYTTQSVDISAYADGTAHEFEFYSESFSDNLDVTNFFVDSVRIAGSASICVSTSAALTLKNEVINDSGGSASESDWVLHANGPTSFSGNGPSVSSGDGFTAGSYDLSQSDGPPGYSASAWVCTGGTQNDGDTITLAPGQSATCLITNNDVNPDFQINGGIAGAWFDPATSGQGQLIDVEPETQFMFISWFTYTDAATDHPFEQRWLTAQGNYSGNTAELDLYETLGGQFDDPQPVTTRRVGDVILKFDDCGQGQMIYNIETEGLQGEFDVQRAIAGSGDVCADIGAASTQAVDINAGMDGAWYDPNTSGQGFLIDSYPDPQGGDFMFVAWFTYGEDTASGQEWLTAQGGFDGAVAELKVYRTTGGSFDSPLPPETERVGAMTIDFIDCSSARLTYTLDDIGLGGEIDIIRAITGTESLCESFAAAEMAAAK